MSTHTITVIVRCFLALILTSVCMFAHPACAGEVGLKGAGPSASSADVGRIAVLGTSAQHTLTVRSVLVSLVESLGGWIDIPFTENQTLGGWIDIPVTQTPEYP